MAGQNDFFDEDGNVWGSYESYQNSYSGDALYNDWAKNPITDASSSNTNKAQSWWNDNGKFIMDGAGNILDAVTKIVVATQGSYDPNQYYTGANGYVQYNPNYYPHRSSGMSATTKIVLFGALGAAIIVGAVLYKKSKRKKRREEREREREEEYEYHRRTSKRRRR